MTKEGHVGTIRDADTDRLDTGATRPPGRELPEVDEQLASLRCLLEQDAVEEARLMIQELQSRWPESERVRHWAEVLAPPLVSVSQTGQARPLHRERAWLRDHAGEYPGCWLAVFEDQLIVADPDLRTVLARTRQALGAERALLHFDPPPTGTRSVEPVEPDVSG